VNDQHAQLWTDERISMFADNAPSAWEARRMYDAMRRIRDDYEAELTRMRGSFETVPDGPLCPWAELNNRTIFIKSIDLGGRMFGYTLGDDEYLVRRVQP
jgi:hypothetical protein